MKIEKYLILLLMICPIVLAGQKIVSGSVLDSSGQPLPGANIIEVGTSNGVSTDFDGNFSITVSGDESVIEVSFTGFESQQITVGDQSSIQISLNEDAELLQEVVVTSLGFVEIRDQMGQTSSKVNTDAQIKHTFLA